MTDYFSHEGRLNRWPYFLRYIGCGSVNLTLLLLLVASMHLGLIGVIIFFFAFTVGVMAVFIIPIFMAMQSIKRLHDLDKSGWYLLIIFAGIIPLIGEIIVLGFVLYLFLVEGTTGSNRFGPDPLGGEARNDTYPIQSLNSEIVNAEYEDSYENDEE